MAQIDPSPLYENVPETPVAIETSIKGEVPKWLSGTLLRNGPGIFRIGPDEYKHLFDGLALIQKFELIDGKVLYSSKYLRSETYIRNMTAHRIVVAEFGTLAVPDPCKNIFWRYFSYYFPKTYTDNDLVNFIQCGDELYAATETPRLNRIDPKTLDTLQRVDQSDYLSVKSITAHPHYDRDGNTYNLGSGYTTYNIVKIPKPVDSVKDNAFEKASIVSSIPMVKGQRSYYHSFGMSENHLIFIESPLILNIKVLLSSAWTQRPFADALQWDENLQTKIHVSNVKTGKLVENRYLAEGFFTFHHANAFEEDGCVVVDCCALKDGWKPDNLTLEQMRSGEFVEVNTFLWRFVLPIEKPADAKTGDNLVSNFDTKATAILMEDGSIFCKAEQLCDFPFEFPRINYEQSNGKKYRYVYGSSISESKLHGNAAVIKYDIKGKSYELWRAEHEALVVGEPVFVARPAGSSEDDGVLLALVSNLKKEEQSFLLVLDAGSMKELARAQVDLIFPLGFHGHYLSQ